jgi:hypothetical protein
MAEYNSQGLEVWHSTHLDNGELRPELRGLRQDEFVKTFVAHAPELTAEQRDHLADLLGPYVTR